MQTYSSAIAEYRAWCDTIVPEAVRFIRSYNVPHFDVDGSRYYTREVETELIYSETQQGLIFERYERIATLDAYEKQAHRQVYITGAVARLKNEIPDLIKIKLIAVSISPKDQSPTGINGCKEIMAILLKMTLFKNGGTYVYEQRSEPSEPPRGWHIHINLKSTYALSKAQQFITQKLAKYVYTFDYKYCDSKWESRYMQGDKGNEKLSKVAGDEVHRAAAGLERFYTF